MFSKATPKQLSRVFTRSLSKEAKVQNEPLYLNPHRWKGLPADRVFELHQLRKDALQDKYVPNDDERSAILSTYTDLAKTSPTLDYVYEMDNFKERLMNNTPANLKHAPPKYSNIEVIGKGSTPHQQRKIEQIHRVSAFEMPLLAKFREAYKPIEAKKTPLKLTYHTDFSDEVTDYNKKVTLSVNLSDLKFEPRQRKNFIILSGNKYDFNTKTLKFSCSRYEDPAQNSLWLVNTFKKLFEESKKLEGISRSFPLDTRHMKERKPQPVFPKEWKRPHDAPVKRNKFVRDLVEGLKEKKDTEYIKQFSP